LSSDSKKRIALSDFEAIFSHIDLSALEGSRIFATGCTGFMGYWLLLAIESLNQRGANITLVALSRDPALFFFKHPMFKSFDWLTVVKGDVLDFTYEKQPFDFIIHGATDTRPECLTQTLQLLDTMQSGTYRVCEQAQRSSVRAMLLISSGAVYQRTFNIDKPGSLPAVDGYGLAKQLMEQIVVEQSKQLGFEVKIARCFAFIGYMLPQHLAAADLINACLTREKIILNSDGSAVRSYLYAADMAVWLLKILVSGKDGYAYDVGSDKADTILNHAKYFRDKLAPNKEVVINTTPPSEQRKCYVPNIKLTKQHVQVDVWTPLIEAVNKTVQMQFLHDD
jgi:dTDP-glucose 4,6-dehydratase